MLCLSGMTSEKRKRSISLQGVFQVLINLHDGSLVTTAVAVIWRTEDGDHVSVLAPVVALDVMKNNKKQRRLTK